MPLPIPSTLPQVWFSLIKPLSLLIRSEGDATLRVSRLAATSVAGVPCVHQRATALAGIGIPNQQARKRPSPDAGAFFAAVIMLIGVPSHFMAGGAREPQGSPVLLTVCQPRVVRRLALCEAADSSQSRGVAMKERKAVQPRTIDPSEALHALLCEARLLAGLTLSMKPQTLLVESEHLATALAGFADRLEAAIRAIPHRAGDVGSEQ